MTQLQVPEVPSAQQPEVQPTPVERMHPVSRRLVGGVLAAGIAVSAVVTAANNESVQNFFEDPIGAVFDPLFDHQPAYDGGRAFEVELP